MTGIEFAAQAVSDQYAGIKYSQLDCQAFVERVLKDCGIRKPDGSIYNWKGTNAMWRQIPGWRGTVEECRTVYGEIPLGAWVFIIRHDGGEVDRGYTDGYGNASHVGIYCRTGADPVRDSTRYTGRDGVGYRPLKSFTHILLPDFLQWSEQDQPEILRQVRILRSSGSSDTDFLKALTALTEYLKGV